MQIEIYADIFFAVNFIMDLLIFWTVSKFIRGKIYFYKIFLGALAASILYCILVFVFSLYYNIWIALLVLIIAVIITFRPKKILPLIKLIILVHIVAFTIGGMTTALFYCIDFSSFLANMFSFKFENFSLKILIVSTCIAFLFVKLFVGYIKRNIISKQIVYGVDISLGKSNLVFNALVDTGNSLHNGLTGNPIIIAEFDVIKNIFPDEIKLAIYERDFEKLCLSSIKFNFVPFKSIGNESGVLICFKPDYLKILVENEKIISDAEVGICNFCLSDSYHGLINPDLIN